MNRLPLISALLLFTMTSCLDNIVCIDGNGRMSIESRTASQITEVVNTTQVDVVYRKADSVSITITAESNLIPHLVTSESGGRLEIKTEPRNTCFDYTVRPVILVTSPVLSSMHLTGSGSLDADTLSGNEVEIRSTGSGNINAGVLDSEDLIVTLTGSGDLSVNSATCIESDFTLTGSGDLEISGNADIGSMRITGSGDIKASDYIIVTSSQTITGSGNIYTTVVNNLNAVISGSGNIYVRGNPTIRQTVTGSGRVIER